MKPYATITIELHKAGIHAYCDDIDGDVFVPRGNDLQPLVDLINDAEICNPETVFKITDKGSKVLEEMLKKKG